MRRSKQWLTCWAIASAAAVFGSGCSGGTAAVISGEPDRDDSASDQARDFFPPSADRDWPVEVATEVSFGSRTADVHYPKGDHTELPTAIVVLEESQSSAETAELLNGLASTGMVVIRPKTSPSFNADELTCVFDAAALAPGFGGDATQVVYVGQGSTIEFTLATALGTPSTSGPCSGARIKPQSVVGLGLTGYNQPHPETSLDGSTNRYVRIRFVSDQVEVDARTGLASQLNAAGFDVALAGGGGASGPTATIRVVVAAVVGEGVQP